MGMGELLTKGRLVTHHKCDHSDVALDEVRGTKVIDGFLEVVYEIWMVCLACGLMRRTNKYRLQMTMEWRFDNTPGVWPKRKAYTRKAVGIA